MSARGAVALGACASLLAIGCQPTCTPKDLSAIEAAYAERVIAACAGQSFDTCPAVEQLKADRLAEEKAGGCR